MDLAAEQREGVFGDDLAFLPGGDGGVRGGVAYSQLEARGRGHDALMEGFAAYQLWSDLFKRFGFSGQAFGELLGALVSAQDEGETEQRQGAHVSSIS